MPTNNNSNNKNFGFVFGSSLNVQNVCWLFEWKRDSTRLIVERTPFGGGHQMKIDDTEMTEYVGHTHSMKLNGKAKTYKLSCSPK
ncbi:hypothetical protein RDWZM_002681 [Blomia tropicalis]|uniref:Uncharacterized protein n=1 Tax=Blomia tropicalis TaxID=40697 RepID=A0A9Q0RRU8_BLOTA|nr:hypothetical protein RDWZM_002681 [Blomia tropicalis]